jgi:hypothetical protein
MLFFLFWPVGWVSDERRDIMLVLFYMGDIPTDQNKKNSRAGIPTL